MAIKHNGIIPYLEVGRLSFNAFIPDFAVPNKISLTITKDVSKNNPFVKIFQLYENNWNKSLLTELLQTERLEVVFCLKTILSKPEAAELNAHKSEIIDYLVNLEKYYRGPDAEL